MKIERPVPIPQPIAPNYARYEVEKNRWVANNPGATPSEYQAAMLRIAQECGV